MPITSKPSHPEPIQALLQHPKIWRASFLANYHARQKTTASAIPSSFTTLDHHLRDGWPLGQLTELNHGAIGIGELSLILPALTQLSTQSTRPIAWIQPKPPKTPVLRPNPQAFLAHGLRLEQLLWITPTTLTDALWAAERCLNSAGCSATLLWLPATSIQSQPAGFYRALQRLQIAAQRTQQWALVVRGGHGSVEKLGHSPAPLRLHLQPTQDTLNIQIIKRPQGWPIAPFAIKLPNHKARAQTYWHWQQLDWGNSLNSQSPSSNTFASIISNTQQIAPPAPTKHQDQRQAMPDYANGSHHNTTVSPNTPSVTGGQSPGI